MKEDKLGQLAGSATITHGATQQLPHIDLTTAGPCYAVGTRLIVKCRRSQTIPLSGMMAHLGHHPAAGAAPQHTGGRELAF